MGLEKEQEVLRWGMESRVQPAEPKISYWAPCSLLEIPGGPGTAQQGSWARKDHTLKTLPVDRAWNIPWERVPQTLFQLESKRI